MPEGIDPNILVGWLILTGIVLGSLYKLGKWLGKLVAIGQEVIEKMGDLSSSTTDHYAKDDERFTSQGLQLAHIEGRLDEQAAQIDRLVIGRKA